MERITTCEHMCAGLGALLCAVPVVINGFHPKTGTLEGTEQLQLAGNLLHCPANPLFFSSCRRLNHFILERKLGNCLPVILYAILFSVG